MSDYDMSIHTNPDAVAWAKFYVQTREAFETSGREGRFDDEENMVGWFANAMMAMHDHLTGQRVTVLPDGSAFFTATVPAAHFLATEDGEFNGNAPDPSSALENSKADLADATKKATP